jgi:hypothetical protein
VLGQANPPWDGEGCVERVVWHCVRESVSSGFGAFLNGKDMTPQKLKKQGLLEEGGKRGDRKRQGTARSPPSCWGLSSRVERFRLLASLHFTRRFALPSSFSFPLTIGPPKHSVTPSSVHFVRSFGFWFGRPSDHPPKATTPHHHHRPPPHKPRQGLTLLPFLTQPTHPPQIPPTSQSITKHHPLSPNQPNHPPTHQPINCSAPSPSPPRAPPAPPPVLVD